ncbi:unnamed protein product [Peronospora belbahrii]|uniref:MSP domain-containing protein n=1 Tax=Peronospora belbahrii TaxID=622444 RepID=A0AAU9L565_9STRA|nr:unnamed protein product [Peronospora belbahrii]CAH0522223.1 unnamed protein product [Peronospora belbahrii]
MITASVGADSSLLLEPAFELFFPLSELQSGHRPRCLLTLTNLSVLNDVVFRIRTRNPDAFTVRPTHGLLAPETSIQVVLKATEKSCKRLSAMDPRDLMTRQSSELFLVQSVEREEKVQAMEPLDPNSSTSIRAFWKKLSMDCVTENKLVCCFVPVPSRDSDVSSNSKLLSRTMSSTSLSSQESQKSRSDNRNRTRSATEQRVSRSGSDSKRSTGDRSVSNQFIPSDEPKEQSRQHLFGVDTNFHTATEPPMWTNGRSGTSTTTLSNHVLPRTPKTRLCDASISGNDSSVSDTMLSAQTSFSAETDTKSPTHELGPLLYHIQPQDTLSFDVMPGPRFWGSTSCYIVNSSLNDCLTFKVRTSNQSGYVVKPSRGLVSPTNAQEVVISLCAPRHETSFDPMQRKARDGFMVEIANISRDKYDDLMKLDERKRFYEISCLWSKLPQSDRQSRTLSVNFNMENSHSGSNILESSESGNCNCRSKFSECRAEKTQRQKLESVIQGVKELSSSLSLKNESCGHTAEVKSDYANSDQFAFIGASTPVPTAVGENKREGDVVLTATNALRDPKVLVVSADRMDMVDFSNPNLSFFI